MKHEKGIFLIIGIEIETNKTKHRFYAREWWAGPEMAMTRGWSSDGQRIPHLTDVLRGLGRPLGLANGLRSTGQSFGRRPPSGGGLVGLGGDGHHRLCDRRGRDAHILTRLLCCGVDGLDGSGRRKRWAPDGCGCRQSSGVYIEDTGARMRTHLPQSHGSGHVHHSPMQGTVAWLWALAATLVAAGVAMRMSGPSVTRTYLWGHLALIGWGQGVIHEDIRWISQGRRRWTRR